jgi:hypothetical protein
LASIEVNAEELPHRLRVSVLAHRGEADEIREQN